MDKPQVYMMELPDGRFHAEIKFLSAIAHAEGDTPEQAFRNLMNWMADLAGALSVKKKRDSFRVIDKG